MFYVKKRVVTPHTGWQPAWHTSEFTTLTEAMANAKQFTLSCVIDENGTYIWLSDAWPKL